jgi:hypothetical protein
VPEVVRQPAATIDPPLNPIRQQGRRQPTTHSQFAQVVRVLARDRTFGDLAQVAPGLVSLDLVAHRGEATLRQNLVTLLVIDARTDRPDVESEPVTTIPRCHLTSGRCHILRIARRRADARRTLAYNPVSCRCCPESPTRGA